MGTLSKALIFAEKAHKGQKRASGADYIEHPKAVVEILKEIYAGPETLCAAILHDTLEDTDVTRKDLEREFGAAVAKLVEGVTKLEKIEKVLDPRERNMQSIRKLFHMMGDDLRVIFIKLADRIHNMRTIEFLRPDKQQRIAWETQNVFCPLAHLLGIRPWYRELWDLSIQVLQPTEYGLIVAKKKKINPKDIRHLEAWTENLKKFLKTEGFRNAHVLLRERHAHGILDSIQEKPALLDNIETYYRICVTDPNENACYGLLGAVHKFSSSLPNHMRDYIAHPKMNGYRALHTTVISPLGKPIKIIIQSEAMSRQAYYGETLPFQLKTPHGERWKDLPPWFDMLLSLEGGDANSTHFFRSLQSEILGDRCRVHVIDKTKRAFIDLPCNASILDAAYYYDERTAQHVTSAVLNRKPVGIKAQVHDGDIIELTAKKRNNVRLPQDLHIVHTSLGQKLLGDQLSKLPASVQLKNGKLLMKEAMEITLDPSFSMGWRKVIDKRLPHENTTLRAIGKAAISPFDVIVKHGWIGDFFILNPECLYVGQQIPDKKIRFVLQTDIETLRSGKIIGVQVRPDVINVLSSDTVQKETDMTQFTKEIVPLHIRNEHALLHPFHFGLQWSFKQGSDPLGVIAALQSMLETPIRLLSFQNNSTTLGFSANSLYTLQAAYGHLIGLPDITSVIRTSPA